MSDLIKRDDAPEQIFASQGDYGWRWPRAGKFPEQGPHENVKYVRADRIEQLVEENKELTLQLLATSGQAADALDKLAKAMEALRELDRRNDSLDTFNNAVHDIVSAVLAKLEGGE